MYLLEKEYVVKFGDILSSKYYKEWVQYFEDVLEVTREKELRNDREFIFSIQVKLASIETEIWRSLRQGREDAEKLHSKENLSNEEEKQLKNLEKHVFINKQIIRISKTICDGIAWRSLNYDRLYLTSAARGRDSGAIDINNSGFREEIKWAKKLTEDRGSTVLINDLTHFLRVSDLTEINDGFVIPHEIKLGKVPKNMFTLKELRRGGLLSAQAKRLLELQKISILKGANIRGSFAKVLYFKLPLRTDLKVLPSILKESEQEIVVSRRINPCLELEVTNYEAAEKTDIPFNVLKTKFLPTSNKLSYSNWDVFYSDKEGNFVRGVVPYSIFPLSSRYCTRLISGHYLIKTLFDYLKLKEILESRNWDVDVISDEQIDAQLEQYKEIEGKIFSGNRPLFHYTPEEKGLLTVRRGPFHFQITPTFYNRMTMEFMSLECFLEMLEEIYRMARLNPSIRNSNFFPAFENEPNVWR